MKRVAFISDISGVGRCSLSAGLPVISALGLECLPVPTSVFTNQTGYESYNCVSLDSLVPRFPEQWRKIGIVPDAILCGYLANEKQVKNTEDFISSFPETSLIVVDPSMAESGEVYKGFSSGMCERIKNLCNQANVITPNVSEYCILTNTPYEEFSSLTLAQKLQSIREKGKALIGDKLKSVIVTGVVDGDIQHTVYVGESEFFSVKNKAFSGHFSGTGDLFSSCVCALLCAGENVRKSIEITTNFLEQSIAQTVSHPHDGLDGIDFQTNLHLLWERKNYEEQKF